MLKDLVEGNLAKKKGLELGHKDLETKFELKMEQIKNQMVIWYIGSFVATLTYLTALIRWAKYAEANFCISESARGLYPMRAAGRQLFL